MNTERPRRALLLAGLIVLLTACATSPTGRPQLQFMPDAQIRAMGLDAYSQMKADQTTVEEGPAVDYVECVAEALIPRVPGDYAEDGWEVTVFESEQVNAFALPGGKMGIYTGLLAVTENQDQLAAVIAHEIAHVMARHANERMSTEVATALGLGALGIAAGDDPRRQQVMAALGVGAQVGILLPFSRTHESEADDIGLGLMADAGFDPRASIQLWENMSQAGGQAPPEFLSTHPSRDTRIAALRSAMPRAVYRYEQALAAGRTPACAD
jgi:predicted Zn-dependent protease